MQSQTLAEYIVSNQPGPFKAGVPYYNRIGDFIDVYFDDERCFAQCLSPSVHVFRGIGSKSIVGIHVNQVASMLDGHLEIHDGSSSWYNSDGDLLEVWLESTPYHAERCGNVDVLRAESGNRIVGLEIPWVSRLVHGDLSCGFDLQTQIDQHYSGTWVSFAEPGTDVVQEMVARCVKPFPRGEVCV